MIPNSTKRVTDICMYKNSQKLSKNACSAHNYLSFLEKFMWICNIFSNFNLFSSSTLDCGSKMVYYIYVTSKLKSGESFLFRYLFLKKHTRIEVRSTKLVLHLSILQVKNVTDLFRTLRSSTFLPINVNNHYKTSNYEKRPSKSVPKSCSHPVDYN